MTARPRIAITHLLLLHRGKLSTSREPSGSADTCGEIRLAIDAASPRDRGGGVE
jgi:hypothetical protein